MQILCLIKVLTWFQSNQHKSIFVSIQGMFVIEIVCFPIAGLGRLQPDKTFKK